MFQYFFLFADPPVRIQMNDNPKKQDRNCL